MSGLIYTATVEDVAITAVQDLFNNLAPADAVLEIHSVAFFQTSDVGDAAEEILMTTLRMVSGSPTTGSGGTTPTPRPHHLGGPASGVTLRANDTTQLTGGTNVVIGNFGLNIRIPDKQIWIPESRAYISPSTRFLWELEDAPADEITASIEMTWKELGG